MKILAVVSAKGGVGKSTVAANLAVALQMSGRSVLAIDLDPQDGLRYHFSLEQGDPQGMVHAFRDANALRALIRPTRSNVALLPFGICDEQQRRQLESALFENATWLRETLDALYLDEDTVVVIDTPPGASTYVAQALSVATVVVVVVLPDAGSYVTLPQMQSLMESYCTDRPDFQDHGFIINQVDQTRSLGKDVVNVLRANFEQHIIGSVHLDQAVCESLAFGQSVLQYAPYSEGASDLRACAFWVENRLFSLVPGES